MKRFQSVAARVGLLLLIACGETRTPLEATAGAESETDAEPTAEIAHEPHAEVDEAPPRVEGDVCAELRIEAATRCELREGGQTLADGARIDVLELTTEDAMRGETKVLVVVLRAVNDPDPILLEVAETYDMPGESVSYEVGEFTIGDGIVTLPLSVIATTYPNTGDPDEPTGEYSEREDSVVRCTRDGEVWDCQQY